MDNTINKLDIANFNAGDYTVKELEALIKAMTKAKKGLKASETETAKKIIADGQALKEKIARILVKKGSIATAKFAVRRINLTGVVTKVSDKTFTIEVEIDGAMAEKWRKYHDFVIPEGTDIPALLAKHYPEEGGDKPAEISADKPAEPDNVPADDVDFTQDSTELDAETDIFEDDTDSFDDDGAEDDVDSID